MNHEIWRLERKVPIHNHDVLIYRVMRKNKRLIHYSFGQVTRSAFPKFGVRLIRHSRCGGKLRYGLILSLGHITVAVVTPACWKDVLCCLGVLP